MQSSKNVTSRLQVFINRCLTGFFVFIGQTEFLVGHCAEELKLNQWIFGSEGRNGLALATPYVKVKKKYQAVRAKPHFHCCDHVNRTTHHRENSFFTRTARLCNDLPYILPECFNIPVFKRGENQHFLLSRPFI